MRHLRNAGAFCVGLFCAILAHNDPAPYRRLPCRAARGPFYLMFQSRGTPQPPQGCERRGEDLKEETMRKVSQFLVLLLILTTMAACGAAGNPTPTPPTIVEPPPPAAPTDTPAAPME